MCLWVMGATFIAVMASCLITIHGTLLVEPCLYIKFLSSLKYYRTY